MLYQGQPEWYAHKELLGVIRKDRTDQDFYAAVFANDGKGVWRPFEVESSIETRKDALALLEKMLKQHENKKIVKQDE